MYLSITPYEVGTSFPNLGEKVIIIFKDFSFSTAIYRLKINYDECTQGDQYKFYIKHTCDDCCEEYSQCTKYGEEWEDEFECRFSEKNIIYWIRLEKVKEHEEK